MEHDRIYRYDKEDWLDRRDEIGWDNMHDDLNYIMITYIDVLFRINSTLNDMCENIDFYV